MFRTFLTLSATLLLGSSTVLADEVAADIKAFHESAGKEWRTDVLEVKTANGTPDQLRILVLEFAPPSKDKPDQVKVQLLLATPITGDAFKSSSSKISTGGFRDVQLEMKNDAKRLTITRSIDTVEKPNKNTPRVLALTAISFTYELKGDRLTLKGFSKEEPTQWGQVGFTAPLTEITFTKQAEK